MTHIPDFVYILHIFASHLCTSVAHVTKLETETDLLETKYNLWFDSAVFMWSYPGIMRFSTLNDTKEECNNFQSLTPLSIKKPSALKLIGIH